MDLGLVQGLVNKPDGISLAEVAALCTECPIEEMVEQISGVLPQARVTALRQAVSLRMETVGQLGRFALAVSFVVMVIGSLVVFTTMHGAVAERRQEIGLFRALGFRRMHIEQIILGEAAALSLAGGILGWLLGMGAAQILGPSVSGMSVAIQWDVLLAVMAIGGALVIGIVGSLYPAIRAARLDPATALRSL